MDRPTTQWWRLGGYFGIAFIVLFIVAIIVQQVTAGEPPSFNDPVQDIRAYFVEEGQGYLLGDYLFGLAFIVLFLPFVVGLRAVLGAAEGAGQLFSRTTLAGGLLATAFSGAAAASWAALAFAAENLDDSAVSLLMYLDAAAWNVVPFPFGLMLLAASAVIFTTGVLWRWLGIAGAIVGVMALISPLWLMDGNPDGVLGILGFVSFIGLALWVLLASIAMVMMKTAPAPVGVTRDV